MGQYKCALELKKEDIVINQYIYEVGGYRYNWHKDIEIMLVLVGKVEVCVEGKIYNLEEGDVILVNSNEGHASLKKDEESIVMVLHMDTKYFNLFFYDKDHIRFRCNTVEENKDDFKFIELRKLLCEMMISMKDNSIEGQFKSLSYLSMLSSHLFKEFYVQNDNMNNLKLKKTKKQLKAVVDYIQENYKEKIHLDDVAKLINYNSSYVSSFFKSNIGINFYEYLLRVRLQSAVIELITTDKPIYHIALDNGFSDVKSFNTAFKKNFNKLPNQYRIENKTVQPILSIEKRTFIDLDNEIINNKLNEHITIDKEKESKKDIKEEKKDSNLDNNQIKILCNKDDKTDEFMEYLRKSNIKIKLEIS